MLPNLVKPGGMLMCRRDLAFRSEVIDSLCMIRLVQESQINVAHTVGLQQKYSSTLHTHTHTQEWHRPTVLFVCSSAMMTCRRDLASRAEVIDSLRMTDPVQESQGQAATTSGKLVKLCVPESALLHARRGSQNSPYPTWPQRISCRDIPIHHLTPIAVSYNTLHDTADHQK